MPPPSGGATAASTPASARMPAPPRIVVERPDPMTVRRPETGASANMPAVCALMTKPTLARSCPWSAMCSGVIVMITTIVTCPTTRAVTAHRDGGLGEELASGRAR